MARKRILVITHQLSRTGAPIVLLDLIRFCIKQNCFIDVITMLDGPLRKALEEMGIEIAVQGTFWSIREGFVAVASDYDLVIANTLITYEAVQALNNTSVPVLWWLHEGEQYFEYFKSVIPDFATIGSNISAYAVGHYVQEVVSRRYGVTLPILHFAVDDVPSAPSAKPIIVEDDKVTFLTAGTYSGVKAQDVLAQAIRLLPVEYQERTCFYFCGNEEMVDDTIFNTVLELDKEYSNVTLLHQLTRDKTLEWMEKVDALIVPSRIDPIPTVAVEKLMKSGILLCTDVCGIAHYIEDGVNGFKVPSESPIELANKIIYICDHIEDLDVIKHEGRKIYEDHFSREVIGQQLTEILFS